MLKKILAIAMVGVAAQAGATNFSGMKTLNQSEFVDLTHDLGSVLSYKGVNPGDPLGVLGFDIGAEITATDIDKRSVMNKATGWDSSLVTTAKLHAQKGLPLNFDIGLNIGRVPGLDASVTGAELRWSPIAGNLAIPAVSVRATYSRLNGVNELDFRSKGIEATISKGFVMLKPYLGVGYVYSTATPHVNQLKKENVGQHKLFGGVNINMAVVNYAVELDQTGNDKTYSAKIGFRF